MTNQYSVAAHWSDDFDEASLQGWAENLRQQLSAPSVSVGLVFMAPKYFPRARQILEILRVHARIPLLAGCSSQGLIVNGEEIEENAGLTLALYHLPNGEFKATQVRLVEQGPVKAVIRVTSQYGRSSLVQDFTLYASLEQIDVCATLDWREHFKLLKLRFPLALTGSLATYESAFGTMVPSTLLPRISFSA